MTLGQETLKLIHENFHERSCNLVEWGANALRKVVAARVDEDETHVLLLAHAAREHLILEVGDAGGEVELAGFAQLLINAVRHAAVRGRLARAPAHRVVAVLAEEEREGERGGRAVEVETAGRHGHNVAHRSVAPVDEEVQGAASSPRRAPG